MKARVTYYVLCITGILIFVLPLILNTVPKSDSSQASLISLVYAADSTPSAEVKTKLQALQAEIASKAAKIKQEISKKLQNKVYAGFIKSKSANSITLATSQGSRIININEYTIYQAQKSKSLSTDDYILALGDIDDTAVLTAKKIIKTASPSGIRQIHFGTVTGLEGQTVIIQTKQGQSISLLTDAETIFRMGKSGGAFDNIKANKPIIAVGTSSAKTLKTRFIYILPYSSPLKIKAVDKPATPSGLPAGQAGKKK